MNKFCTYCGSPIDADDKFCFKCGKTITQSQSPSLPITKENRDTISVQTKEKKISSVNNAPQTNEAASFHTTNNKTDKNNPPAKKNLKKLVLIFVLIAVSLLVFGLIANKLSVFSFKNQSSSDQTDTYDIHNFKNDIIGVWIPLNDPFYENTVIFHSISEEMELISGVYPGEYDKAELRDIQKIEDGVFQVTIYTPATPETDLNGPSPESSTTAYFYSNDMFRTSLIIEYEDHRKWEYEFISTDFDIAVDHFDKILSNRSNETPTEQQEITKTETIPQTKHSHNYSNWIQDSTEKHAKYCTCGDKITESHIYDSGVITNDGLTTGYGIKRFTCTICEFSKEEHFKAEMRYYDYPCICNYCKHDDGKKKLIFNNGVIVDVIWTCSACGKENHNSTRLSW